jgi:methionyl aminopeptidase
MDNKKEEIDKIKKCGNPVCDKEGKLRCPNCTKLKLEMGSYFCAQDCFKTYWNTHKKIHDECKF